MAGCGDLLIGQLEFYWDVHLWPRLQGLTDDEFFWEPVAGMWSLRPDATGAMVYELESPVGDPVPVTTIAWRLVHIAVGCFAIRVNTFYAVNPDDADMFDPRHLPTELPADAAAGLVFLEHWYARWHDAIRSLDEDQLRRPLGPRGAHFGADPMLGLIAHVNREVMHHGGEIGVLRDLYRAGVGR